jgi:hypothetical protein
VARDAEWPPPADAGDDGPILDFPGGTRIETRNSAAWLALAEQRGLKSGLEGRDPAVELARVVAEATARPVEVERIAADPDDRSNPAAGLAMRRPDPAELAERFGKAYRQGRAECRGHPGRNPGDSSQETRRKPLFLLPDQFPTPQPPRLIKGYMAHGDELCVWGPPEAGKSFFAVDMACRFAAPGEHWRGRLLDHGTVVYLAGERQASIRDRITAWRIRNGKVRVEPPVLVLNQPLNLMRPRPGELVELAEMIQGIVAEHELPPVVAMVADTIHSLSPGSKEDAQSFGWLIANVRELRELVQRPGQPLPAVIYVHHSGKNEDNGPRGSNSLPAGMNLSLGISVVQGKWRVLEPDKNSDLAHRPQIEPFVIESITVRHDEDGEPVRVGVHIACGMEEVRYLDEDAAKAKAASMKGAGASYRQIAKHVDRSVSTVHKWLK